MQNSQWRVPSRGDRGYLGSGVEVVFGVQSQRGMEGRIDAVQIHLPEENTRFQPEQYVSKKEEKHSVMQLNASGRRRWEEGACMSVYCQWGEKEVRVRVNRRAYCSGRPRFACFDGWRLPASDWVRCCRWSNREQPLHYERPTLHGEHLNPIFGATACHCRYHSTLGYSRSLPVRAVCTGALGSRSFGHLLKYLPK